MKEDFFFICNSQEIDLKNDVWTVIGANGTSVNTGSPGSLRHSHDTKYGKYQGMILCRDINIDDD
ncbi:hypothetical protein C1646_759054 [Rhizophagus diaphanus]|nr:hypothetical protein C1646_759054 [Rhizophagus diaphanus] [Rhizophagus sp. MUCL 43196]